MSDESSTPSLRLRPRLRVEQPAAPAAAEAPVVGEVAPVVPGPSATPASDGPPTGIDGRATIGAGPSADAGALATPEASASSGDGSSPRLRLKPRLGETTAPFAAPDAEASSTSASPASEPGESKLKLKPRPSAAGAASEAAQPPLPPLFTPPEPLAPPPAVLIDGPATIPPSSSTGATVPPIPLRTPNGVTIPPLPLPGHHPAPLPVKDLPPQVAPPKVVHVPVAVDVPASKLEESLRAKAKAAVPANRSAGGRGGLWLLLMILGGGGYFAYTHYFAPPPAPAPAAADGKTPSANNPVVANPASMPGKAVGKAQDVLAARRDAAQERVEGMLEDRSAPGAINSANPAADNAAPAAASASGGSATITSHAPAPTPTPTPVPVVEEPPDLPPTPAMLTWSERIQIGGVVPTPPARALLNGRLVRAGELVDPKLNLRFIGVDAPQKLLRFGDPQGRVVTRKY